MLAGRAGETYWWFPDRRLGLGRFGEVFEATTVDELRLAVKQVPLRGDTTARWYEDARLAELELEVAARLGSGTTENVMPVLDDCLTDDALFVVMPRADHSLDDLLIREGSSGEADTRKLLIDLAKALRFLAQHGVVHRDVKPTNILWWQGRWVLADLGIARILDVDTGTYTWAGTGTHAYWAPELFSHEPANVATDLYALGCVAVTALTGEPPFSGNDLARAHRLDAPNIPEIRDVALERTIRRLLSKEPGGRPADARMVQQLLEPTGPLGPDQQALLRAATRTARRTDENQRLLNLDQERANQRRDALAALERTVEDTVSRARQSVPGVTAVQQGDTWFITAEEAAGRLVIQAVEPSSRREQLLIGTVVVGFLDQPEKSSVANILCEYHDGRPNWHLVKFAHNHIIQERPPLGPRRAADKAGLSLQHLDGLLAELFRPGAPPLVIEKVPLTPEALLTELGAELDSTAQ